VIEAMWEIGVEMSEEFPKALTRPAVQCRRMAEEAQRSIPSRST
jgi:hypothetical protein